MEARGEDEFGNNRRRCGMIRCPQVVEFPLKSRSPDSLLLIDDNDIPVGSVEDHRLFEGIFRIRRDCSD